VGRLRRRPDDAPRAAASRPAAEDRAQAPSEGAAAEALFSQEIPRFRRSERELHWAIAIPFMVCLASGIAVKLFFNHLHAQLLVHTALLWVHRISGAGLIILPAASAWRHRNDLSLYLYNVKRAWSWSLDDLKWLALIGPASFSRRVRLPDQHKFNAGEKINFMALMLTYPVLVVTGALLYTPGIHFLSFVAHVSVAILAAPLIFGHVFMAVVNPETRVGLSGMFSGNVDREWARHHYAKWYRENFREDQQRAPLHEAPAPTLPRAEALVRCKACGAESPLASWNTILDSIAELRPLECPACGAASAVVSAVVQEADLEKILENLERAGVRGPRLNDLPADGHFVRAPAPDRFEPILAPCPEGG
jgi:formate dehydrogenase gamma subunit